MKTVPKTGRTQIADALADDNREGSYISGFYTEDSASIRCNCREDGRSKREKE